MSLMSGRFSDYKSWKAIFIPLSEAPSSADSSQSDRVNVLGVGLSPINYDLALEAIGQAIESRRKGYVCVTGVHGVSEAQESESFRDILNGAFLNTPDGMPMVWMGKLDGREQMDRVYGPDLMLAVCERSCESGWKHFFYGGGDGVTDKLEAGLRKKFPDLPVVGAYTPPFRPLNAEENAELQEMVATAAPDIVWVGLSTPKQEKFMSEYLEQLDTTLMFGVGAAFDFHAGLIPQAPHWMQRSGLEWFYRLCKEPRRLWKRYLKNNPLFAARVALQLTGIRKYRLQD